MSQLKVEVQAQTGFVRQGVHPALHGKTAGHTHLGSTAYMKLSQSASVMLDLAATRATPAAMATLVSSIQPTIHWTWFASATALIFSAGYRPPHFISLMFRISAASKRQARAASTGEWMDSSSIIFMSTLERTSWAPSTSHQGRHCSTASTPASHRPSGCAPHRPRCSLG